MKTLILYETRTGYTKECADTLHSNIKDSHIFDITSKDYSLNDFDTILVGAPIYIGEIEKKTSRFFHIHKLKLLNKKLGIFCAGMNKEEFSMAVQNSLPPDVFYHAEIVHCGGRIEYKKLTFREKLTLRRRLGIKKSENMSNENEVESFIEWVNSDMKEKRK